jgi:hypothetical protein
MDANLPTRDRPIYIRVFLRVSVSADMRQIFADIFSHFYFFYFFTCSTSPVFNIC